MRNEWPNSGDHDRESGLIVTHFVSIDGQLRVCSEITARYGTDS